MSKVPWALVASWGAAILGGLSVVWYSALSSEDQARFNQLVEDTAINLYGLAFDQLSHEQAHHVEVIARQDFAA